MNLDTIAAIATASGVGGVGIVRISGPNAKQIGETICEQDLAPRLAHYTAFKNKQQEVIDNGIAIYFKGPSSFTGEDTVELQGHGGALVLDLLLKQALQDGARLARPGEFTERAFLNDKIDLVQAEAIADIIESHSESSLRASLRSLSGEFSNKINDLVDNITQLRIYVEAAIDFPEEEVDFLSDQHVNQSLKDIINTLEAVNQNAKSGSVLNHGLNVAIIGKPNTGKSSLLNALAADDIAIVTPTAGTTRDIIKQNIILNDIPLTIIDTAGLRLSDDLIEQEGIRRIKKIAESADVVFYLRDASTESLDADEKTFDELINQHEIPLSNSVLKIIINNKIDLVQQQPSVKKLDAISVICLSVKQKQGLDLIAKVIKEHHNLNNNSENTLTARRRHLKQLEIALTHLLQGRQQLQDQQAGELLAEDLRQAQNALGEITGKVSSDDLLGEIFSSFCIGK